MKDKETNLIILIILLTGFVFGFIVAQAIYDKRPITEEEYHESQKQQYYEDCQDLENLHLPKPWSIRFFSL
jgi:hypothetical protein